MSTQQPVTALPRPQPQFNLSYNHTIRQQWATADCSTGFKLVQPKTTQQQQHTQAIYRSTGKICYKTCDLLEPLSNYELVNAMPHTRITERAPTPFPEEMLDTDDEEAGSEEDAPKLCFGSRKYSDDHMH